MGVKRLGALTRMACGIALALCAAMYSPAQAQRVTPFIQSFSNSVGLAFDSKGRLFVANGLGTSVVTVEVGGIAIDTVATGFQSPQSVAFDAEGNLYVANAAGDSVSKVTPDGKVSTFATGFSRPQALAFNHEGILFVADEILGTVSRVGPGGHVSAFAKGFTMPAGLAFDSKGNLYVADAFNNSVSKVNGLGKVTSFAAGFAEPMAVAVDADDNVYVAELIGAQVSKVTSKGEVSVFASGLPSVQGLAFDRHGNLYAAGLNNTITKITPKGVATPFAPPLSAPGWMAFNADGDLFIVNHGDNTIKKATPEGRVTTFATGFQSPQGLAFDAKGTLYVADAVANTVSKVDSDGTVTRFARGFTAPQGLAFDADGTLYVAGNTGGNIPVGSIQKVTPKGSASTFVVFDSDIPYALAFDGAGNLYASMGQGGVDRIDKSGNVTSFGSGFGTANGIAFDAKGDLYVADGGYKTIVKVTPDGTSTQISTAFSYADGLAFDPGKHLDVSDSIINIISRIDLGAKPISEPNARTKADLQEEYVFQSSVENSHNFGSQACEFQASGTLLDFYASCAEPSAVFENVWDPKYFRYDIGLDRNGALPPSGYGQSPEYTETAVIFSPGPTAPGYTHLWWLFLNEMIPPPNSINQSFKAQAKRPLYIDLTKGSYGNPFQATLIGTSIGGTTSGFPGTTVTFTPHHNFTGVGHFTFVMENYDGVTQQATAFIAVGIPPVARPVVTAISPTVGTSSGGTKVTITGTNLGAPSVVDFGGIPAKAVSTTATKIIVESPAVSAPGPVDVTVSSAGGTSATKAADKYTYD